MSLQSAKWSMLTASTILLGMAIAPASAQSIDDVAARVKSNFTEQGVEIEWKGLSGDLSSMVMQGVSFKAAGTDSAFEIGDLTLENISEADGNINVGSISSDAYSRNDGPTSFEISPMVMKDVILFGEASSNPFGGMMYYRSIRLDDISMKNSGKTAFAAKDISATMSEFATDKPVTMEATVPNFTADLTLVDDPKYKDAIEALGYQTINGSIRMEGSWNAADGDMNIVKYDTKIDNAGTLGISMRLGGYTTEFIKSMQELQKQMAEASEEADSSAQGMAMLGLMQQLSFNSTSIRFTDDSLTNKLLDYFGKQQGVSGKDVANQAKAIVPFGLAQLQNPELTAQASAAVNQFLDNPGSLEISAAPASPVPFALIMADAMANPTNLTKTLAVSVKANQN